MPEQYPYPDMGTQTFRDPEAVQAISSLWGGSDDTAAASMPARSGRPLLRLQYWRKCTRPGCAIHTNKKTGINPEFGWITTGPTMQGDPYRHADFINAKHMEPLPKYGSTPTGTGPEAEMTNPVTRFKKILERPEGLWEFPVDQMRAYGWDKNPTVLKYRPEVAIDRMPCDYGCYGRDFTSLEGKMRHNKAVHPDVVAPMAAAKGMEASIKALLAKEGNGLSAEELKQIGLVVASAVSEMERQKEADGKYAARRTKSTEVE